MFAVFRPNYPVLLCGLDGAGKTTLLRKWHAANGCPNPNATAVDVQGGSTITFSDLKWDSSKIRETFFLAVNRLDGQVRL